MTTTDSIVHPHRTGGSSTPSVDELEYTRAVQFLRDFHCRSSDLLNASPSRRPDLSSRPAVVSGEMQEYSNSNHNNSNNEPERGTIALCIFPSVPPSSMRRQTATINLQSLVSMDDVAASNATNDHRQCDRAALPTSTAITAVDFGISAISGSPFANRAQLRRPPLPRSVSSSLSISSLLSSTSSASSLRPRTMTAATATATHNNHETATPIRTSLSVTSG